MIASDLELIVKALTASGLRYLVGDTFAVLAHGCLPLASLTDLELTLLTDNPVRIRGCLNSLQGQLSGDLTVVVLPMNPQEFAGHASRSTSCELADGVAMPVCGYADLVRSKERSGRQSDRADLDQLRKVRQPRRAYDPWYACTFEGSDLWQLWHRSDLTLGERLRSMDESLQIGRKFAESRR